MNLILNEEKLIKWSPADGLLDKYYLYSIINNKEKIMLTFSCNDQKKIVMSFDQSCLAYRISEEGSRSKTIYNLTQNYEKEFYVDWMFFKVYNSEYIQLYFNKNKALDYKKIIHYFIIEDNSIIDILAYNDPIIEIIE